jgi:hypothetical protein
MKAAYFQARGRANTGIMLMSAHVLTGLTNQNVLFAAAVHHIFSACPESAAVTRSRGSYLTLWVNMTAPYGRQSSLQNGFPGKNVISIQYASQFFLETDNQAQELLNVI